MYIDIVRYPSTSDAGSSRQEAKRARMDESSVPLPMKFLVATSPAFEEIVGMPSFVDHSGLISVFLSDEIPKKMFIVAPSRFCKTANFKMIQSFLEIEVCNENEGEKWGDPRRDVTCPVEDMEVLEQLPNYKLFRQGECSILADKDFVREHFGRYPVIYVDFAVQGIFSFQHAVDHCKIQILKAFQRHKYLTKSSRLDRDEREYCERWCSRNDYKTFNVVQLQNSLVALSEFLHKHFERKVIIMIDEYDAVVTSATFNLIDVRELTRVCDLLIDLVGRVGKGEMVHVERLVLTGISVLPVSGLSFSSRLSEIATFKFGANDAFVPFYGITIGPIRELVVKLKKNNHLPRLNDYGVENIIKRIENYFNGYYHKSGISTYSLWSILHFLQSGEPFSHTVQSNLMLHLSAIMEFPSISAKFLELAGEGNVTIRIVERVSVSDLEELRGIVEGSNPNRIPNSNVVFSLFLELGYLSNVEGKMASPGSIVKAVKAANEEMRREFLRFLVKSRSQISGFDTTLFEECGKMLTVMCTSLKTLENVDTKILLEQLKDMRGKLKDLFEGFNSYKLCDLSEAALLSVLFIVLSRAGCDRIAVDYFVKGGESRKRPSTGRPDLWMKHSKSGVYCMFELKFSRNANSPEKNKSSLFALREAFGEEGKASYVLPLSKLEGNKFIVFGLSMNTEFQPSICCLANAREFRLDDVVCASETEPENFPEYYRGCHT